MQNNIVKRKILVKLKIFELKHLIIKSIIKNKKIKSNVRWYYEVLFLNKRKSLSVVKLKKNCLFTGRSRGFYNFARISRLVLRDNNFISKLPGLQKSSW
jgi:ribosomal protein S14